MTTIYQEMSNLCASKIIMIGNIINDTNPRGSTSQTQIGHHVSMLDVRVECESCGKIRKWFPNSVVDFVC